MATIRKSADNKFIWISVPDAKTEAMLDKDPEYSRVPGQLKWFISPKKKKDKKKKVNKPAVEEIQIEEKLSEDSSE